MGRQEVYTREYKLQGQITGTDNRNRQYNTDKNDQQENTDNRADKRGRQ